MERYNPNPFEKDNPDKTGESKTSKKKSKKNRKFPLPLEKEDAKKQSEKSEKPFESKQEKSDNPEQKDQDNPEEALELSEIDGSESSEPPYLGELIIDHSDELNDDSEPGLEDTSEIVNAVEPDATAESESYGQEPAQSLPESSISKQAGEASNQADSPRTSYVDYESRAASAQHEVDLSLATQEQALFHAQEAPMPVTDRMFNPSEWRSEDTDPTSPNRDRQQVVPERESSLRSYRAKKRGQRQGLAAGGVAGWWLGRRNSLRQNERYQANLYNDTQLEIKRLNKEVEELKDINQKRESAFIRAQQKLRSIVERNWDTNVFRRQETLITSKTEDRTEPKPVTPSAKAEVASRVPEKDKLPIEDREITEEMYKAPEGHRYETSAWHRVEIDEKTGRLVEQPRDEYGEAFHQEQQQEKLAREAAQAQTAAQIATAMGLSSKLSSSTPTSIVDDSNHRQPVVRPSRQPFISLDDYEFAKKQLIQGTTSPATWAVAVLILIFLLVTNLV